ncbi:proteoglycan-like sulfated glycoprotein papilin isoform X3 [Cotesia typhae]|uniref:proteoglycan-like sulfated glycoprotein papilin isoform X3 n=1 Tax=Cotesia typhae TaxID=2053667 RepID=UPI003D695554
MINVRNTWSLVLLLSITACRIADVAGRFHHIKFRHARHRRQHTEGYLPSSFVAGNDDPEEGLWGPWSAPSSCSRSCGGGVAHQTRRCLDTHNNGYDRCTGAKKRFFSCNIQPCPGGSGDFRAEQCAEFNSVPYEDVFYDWVPYTGAPNKCELNCMPKGERFFYRHKLAVVDGTPCEVEKNDVCVEGKCMPVGCDMMLGSDAREDACRECGGDGSDCNTVSGFFDTDDLQVGYIDILLIPEGATNIAIKEIAPSNNYLAIRNTSGHYYLNGNWKIDFPRSLKFANTIFHYARDPQGFSAPDTITTLGPTSEAIYVVLLYQDRNVGVEYKYSIPKKFSPQADPDSYTWTAGEFSECSATCGGGYKSRRVNCVRRRNNEPVDENLCDPQLEPDDTQSCGDEACPPEWVESQWTPCSKQCGEGGERTREIKCEQIIVGGIPSIVDDSMCIEKLGPKKETTQECNRNVTCPTFHLGPWKPCDHLCGEGKQTRKVTCYKKNDDGKIEVLDDLACEGEVPEREKPCELRPCAGLDWVVSEWSGCEDKCGLTQETRTAHCATQDGTIYPDDKCEPDKKPELTRDCENTKGCEYQWYSTQWSECSAKCGKGVQTRKVFCATFEDDVTLKKVEDEKCKPEKRYNDTKECTSEIVECKGEWFAGPWSKCSKPCGGGDMIRKVICLKDGMITSTSNCDENSIMFSSEECNKHPCGKDEVIPVEPGKDDIPTDEEDYDDDDDECEVYEDEDFVTLTTSLKTDEGETGSTELSSSISPFESTGFSMSTLEDTMMSDEMYSRGDMTPTDFESGYTSGDGSGDDEFTLFTNVYTDTSSNRDFSTTEGSGATTDEDTTDMETDLTTGVSVSEEFEETSGSTDISDVTEASMSTDSTSSNIASSTDESAATESSGSTDGSSMASSESSGSSEASDVTEGSTEASDVTEGSTEASDVTEGSTEASGATEESSESSSSSTEQSFGSTEVSASSESTLFENTIESSSEASTVDSSDMSTESSDFTTTESNSSTVDSSTSSDSSASTELDMTTVSSETESTESSQSTESQPTDTTEPMETTSSEETPTTSSEETSTTSSEETPTTSSEETPTTSSEETPTTSSEETQTTSSTDTSVTETTVSSTDTSDVSETSQSSSRSETTSELPFTILLVDGESDSEGLRKDLESSSESSESTDDTTDASESSSEVSTTEVSGSTDLSTTESSTESSEMTESASTNQSTSDSSDATESEMTTESGGTTESGATTESRASTESSSTTESGASTESSGITESGATTESGGTTESGATSESESSTELTGSTESVGSTETETEASTVSGETTESGATTESGMTEESTVSGTTSTDEEETDMTGKSDILDLFTTISPVDAAISKEHKLRKCKIKRKKKKSCRTSEFNCCYDGITPAKGPFGKGCPTPQTCAETTFGCCPDGVSVAAGPKNEDCPSMHCNESLFGCCQDGVTPAEGNDFEGCKKPCNQTEFGCCPDNETPADGENNLGCCNSTEFGCCPNRIKPATGPNEEGCEETTEETREFESTTPFEGDCANSAHGCCPDGKTPATGVNFEGCGVINAENCTASYFGCCADGVTPALGERGEGCHSACESSTHGCCPDRLTRSHGPGGEGCCLTSPYGCCPDNILPARGPDFYGCGCEYSRFRCCPDNVTAARGHNNEGCGCQYTPHGCCPNKFTPATGPNFEGCACYTYQFGCCPDGVTIAKGPRGHGCGCENTEFGCCSDDRTPAKGPNFAGCACDASKYGCCSDGVEEAQGENFEGCRTVPVVPGAACSLSRDRGSCRDFSVKWFFDTEYGGCSRFWYGGCDGNDNRFKTQEECKDTCVSPTGRDVCYLPKSTGPCEGYYPMWYYDSERKQCGQFIYGGCLGNNNKFKTHEECEQLCVVRDDSDPCELDKESGPCEGNFTRWYFNKDSQACEQFRYGGCKPNTNNFPTEVACHQQCLQPGRSKDSCSLPRAEGNCTEKYSKWYFDHSENRCMPFYYTGCGGNKNNYDSRDACEVDCPPKIEQDLCLLPALLGECHNYTQRWYYDSFEQRCRQFFYGGCGGNENNFNTEEDCSNRCVASVTKPPDRPRSFSPAMCFLPDEHGPCRDEQVKWFYDSRDGICKQFRYGGCASNGNKFESREECEYRCGEVQDLCSMPKVVGPCSGSIIQFYYNHETDTCEEFEYSECGGNKNRFPDNASCESKCKRRRPPPPPPPPVPESQASTSRPDSDILPNSPICLAPVDAGPCNSEITAYYYDPQTQACQAFIYGGCEGNANRFQSEEQCERLCGRFQGQDSCNIPSDAGPCRGNFIKYFYDPNARACRQFYYSGCDGNANRFSTVLECESVCLHREEPTPAGNNTGLSHFASNEIEDVDNKNVSKDPCVEAKDECNTVQCPYGKEAYVDDQDCERCRCADPCRSVNCPEGSRCSITLAASADQGTEYRAVCRTITKPGRCPIVSYSTRCEKECETDAECPGEHKCCDNGCGTSCLEPASEEPLVTSPPTYNLTAPPYGAEPAAIQQPTEPHVSGEEGGYVSMKCIATGNPTPIITWRKDATVINPAEKRRRILLDGTLEIINLYSYDRGTYICFADNGLAPPVKTEYQLEVTEPHERQAAIVGEPNTYVTVTMNSPTTLYCYAMGWPRPFVTWWHGDRMLPLTSDHYEQDSEYTLLIRSVTLTNLGVYTCQAYNGIQRPSSWSMTLQAIGPVYNVKPEYQEYTKYLVEPPKRPNNTDNRPHYPYRPSRTQAPHYNQTYVPIRSTRPTPKPYIPAVIPITEPPPEPSQIKVPVVVNVTSSGNKFPVGSDFSIACTVDGYPIPQVLWYKDNEILRTDGRITISETNRLMITNAGYNDTGKYRCEAYNGYSNDSAEIDIAVEGTHIDPECQDNTFFARCDLIVIAKYCQHKYYAKFCCRSCTEAGQLPPANLYLKDSARRKKRSFRSIF